MTLGLGKQTVPRSRVPPLSLRQGQSLPSKSP